MKSGIFDDTIKGRVDITKQDRDALEAGYLVKMTMLNRCPKKGDFIGATFEGTFTRCEIYAKEFLGTGNGNRAYRVIFGRWPS